MKYVIINADDFGLSDGICKSIRELFNSSALTNTSLMVAAPGAINRIRNWKGDELLGIAGVHLQLSGGIPLSPINEVASLVDLISGKFKDPRSGAPVNPEEVEREWRLQITAARDLLGGLPTHLDTHHGVHRIPELFEIYRKLANELDIPIRGATAGVIKNTIKDHHLKATVAIIREWTGRGLDAQILKDQIDAVISNNPEENVLEVITHPGYSDPYLESVSSLSNFRENDHSILLELAQRDWWKIAGYTLVSYRDFNNGLK
jgi:hypothetical protein